MAATPVTPRAVEALVQKIAEFVPLLPQSVKEGTVDDRMYQVMTGQEYDEEWMTMNKRLDALFGSDCYRDGRLHYIRRGRYGMDLVVSYLQAANWTNLPCDLVMIKLQRIWKELQALIKSRVADLSAQTAAPFGPERRHTRHSNPAAATAATTSAAPVVTVAAASTSKRQSKQRRTSQAEATVTKSHKKDKDADADSDTDKNYAPPHKQGRLSEESETEYQLDNDGFEMMSDDGTDIEIKRGKRKRVLSDDDDSEKEAEYTKHARTKKNKKKKEGKKRKAAQKQSGNVEIPVAYETDSDNEKEAPSNRRGPQNKSMEHFREPKAVILNGKQRTLSCPRTVGKDKTLADEPALPKGIGNLATHLRINHNGGEGATIPGEAGTNGEKPVGFSVDNVQMMAAWLEEGKLNPKQERTQEGFYRVFAAWVVEDDLALTTGETEGIKRLFKYMESRFLLPSDTTVRKKLEVLFETMYKKVRGQFEHVKSKIAISEDSWSMKSMTFTFAAAIAGFIDDEWKLIEHVISFEPIFDKDHEGQYAAKNLAKTLSDMRILEQISPALTLDNASVNDVLVATLGRLLREKFNIQFVPENSQIRCLCHVANLVCQKILAVLKESEDPDIDDYFTSDKGGGPIHYDPAADEELRAMEKELEAMGDDDGDMLDNEDRDFLTSLYGSAETTSSPLKKLRIIVTKVCSSPQRRRQFRKASRSVYGDDKAPSGTKLQLLMVVRDVRTRWNSTHAMIQRALLLRKSITRWVGDREEFNGLSLSPVEWDLLKELEKILGNFTKVTLLMSQSGVPTLPYVLPMYEHMKKSMQVSLKETEGRMIYNDLYNAISGGLAKLEKYYEPAWECQYNTLATMLHPHFGLSWFYKVSRDRGDNAKTLFEHVYGEYKKRFDADPSIHDAPIVQPRKDSSDMDSFVNDIAKADEDDCMGPSFIPVASELDRFYAAKETFNKMQHDEPLLWWKEHQKDFPVIAEMARDILCIPGASVAVERLFSSARRLCDESRSCMKADTISTSMLLKSWIKDGFLDFN